MVKKLYGTRLRELRLSKGYSQEKFAQISGIDRTYIAGIESGKRNLSLENMAKIAKAFDMTLSEFCNWEQPIHKTILLKINQECFIVEADTELTPELKDEIELICRCAFDEDSALLEYMDEDATIDDLYNLSVYELADIIVNTIKGETGVDLVFKAIDLEAKVDSY